MMTRHHPHIPCVSILLLALFASCGPRGNTFRIRGNIRDMQAGEIYIYTQDGPHARLDTLTVQEGKFQYKGQADEPIPCHLLFPNGVEQVIFVGPGEDLQYEASANDLRNYKVEGMEENELLNRFRQETHTLNPTAVTAASRTYINDHPQSLASIYLLDTYFVQNENVSPDEITPLMRLVKAHHPHHHRLLDIESKLASQRGRQAGHPLPDVTLTSASRHPVRLWSSQREYTLLVFWAIWAPSGSEVLWNLRRYNEKHPHPDRLRVVAISLDVEHSRWEDAIRQDSTLIEHYCDGRSFESPAIKALGISTVPSYILTDRHHRVLESGEDMKKLEETLNRHLKP